MNVNLSAIARDYFKDDIGAVAVEYAIIAVAMFLAIIPSFIYVADAVGAALLEIGGYFAS